MSDDFEERARKRLGSVISEKYRIDALLGVGGVAAVFAATHRNGHRVALKMLHREHSQSADVKARFLREGYLANRVDHAGAVRVLDDEVDADGSAYLVMELLEGMTVEGLRAARQAKLALDVSLAIADATLDVLAAAHAAGVVHRDVKPANVFLTRARSLKVLDFGVARLVGGASMTRTGEVWGTPAFMAPEQARGDPAVDHRVDLWAVGAMLFFLLADRDVHQAVNQQMVLVLTATRPPRPLASVAPEVPAPIAAVVDRALAFEPARRWLSAGEMQAALRQAHEYAKLA